MLTSEAHVQTDRPSRYLVQLCRHFNHQGRHLRHRPITHHGGEAHADPEGRPDVEWSETYGTVNFGWGQCTMQATPATLTLRAEASDEEMLQRVQELVTGHLDRFGRRDDLKVSWQGPQAPTVAPGNATSDAPATPVGAVARRQRRKTIGLAAVGALAITVHLWLGGAALAALRWTGLAADIVLAVLLVKIIGVTAIALRRLPTRRSMASKAPASSGPRTVIGFLSGQRGNPMNQKSMMRSEARVPTPRGERYAKQVCSHAAWKTPRADWTPPKGVIEFPDKMGTCRMTVEPDHLVLAIEATDPVNLARMQEIVGGLVERFASREGLKVEWVQN